MPFDLALSLPILPVASHRSGRVTATARPLWSRRARDAPACALYQARAKQSLKAKLLQSL
jgi:hypothetical protein